MTDLIELRTHLTKFVCMLRPEMKPKCGLSKYVAYFLACSTFGSPLLCGSCSTPVEEYHC